jgi:hypothetical protein
MALLSNNDCGILFGSKAVCSPGQDTEGTMDCHTGHVLPLRVDAPYSDEVGNLFGSPDRSIPLRQARLSRSRFERAM